MITLNNIKIPGYNQKVSAGLKLDTVDMSGNSSYTPQAETGDKPKTLSIRTTVKFDNPDDLRKIITLSEAKNSVDERTVYNIINVTANTMNIRQVRFHESVTVKENENVEAWQINLSLIEYFSIPEKKESRLTVQNVTEQAPTGSVISDNAITPAETDQSVDLTAFEKALKDVDTWLGS